jgi:hypothetical protein
MKFITPRLLRHARETPVILANNAAHQFAAGYATTIYQASAIYTFIPKNACSTLRFSVALANGCIATDDDLQWIHNNNLTFRPTLAELATAKYAFVFLRDPFRRIASCFLDKFVERQNPAWRFNASTGYKMDLDSLTFRQFIRELPAFLRLDEHWRPQADFLIYERYDDAFSLEDFGCAVDTLKRKIGFTVHDARHLVRHGADRYQSLKSETGFCDMPVFEIAAMKRRGGIPAIESLFDDEIIGAIRKMYAEDFAIYDALIGKPPLFA